MADRVVVFIDYQNAYRAARRAFHHHEAILTGTAK